MRSTGTTLTTFFAAFLVIAIAGGLFWANLNFVAQVPGGEDFIVPWKAMQNFMMQGVTPYGKLTSLNIQTAIYHNPLRAGQNPYPVNIPLHLLIFYLPLSWIGNFSIARAIWLSLLEAGVFGVVFSSLRLLRWNPGWIFLLFILLFCSFWQPSVVMVVTATPVILQALLICVALLSLELQFDELAGALAVLSLMNIEATGLAFVVLVVWVFSTRRWRVLGGVLMTLVVLLALSFLLQPAWLLGFFGAALANWRSGFMPSTYSLFESWMPGIGHRVAQILAAGALSVLLIELRAVRGQDVRWLFWTTCMAAVLAPLLGLPYYPHWLVFTLPGLLLVVSVMVQRWRLVGLINSILILALIFAGLWWAQLNSITSVFILFYPLLMTVLLYWVRWGMVRQPRLWADQIRLRG